MDKLDNLRNVKSEVLLGGGKEKIDKQHSLNKLTARERISYLLDEGSFVELDALVSQRMGIKYSDKNLACDGVVCGYGTIMDRPVCVYAQDYTVLGASLGEMHANKILKVMDMAAKTGVPVIGLTESAGIRLKEGLNALDGLGKILAKAASLSGVVPQISVVMGPLAGIASSISQLSDFTFMTDKTSSLFVNGPQVVKGNSHNDVTAESLGGAKKCLENGKAHFVYEGDKECLDAVKDFLSFLPDNNLSDTLYMGETDDINRISSVLNQINPDDINTIITEIVDNGRFVEIQKDYAKNIIAGFAHLGGESIGIVANNGLLDTKGCEKISRFVRFLDSFNIPVLTFTNVDGFEVSLDEEDTITKAAANLICAYSEATVAKINVITGKASGGAYLCMGSKHIGADVVFSYPDAEISVLSSSAAANIMFKDDIAESDDPINERKAKIEEYKEKEANPYVAASLGFVDDVIEPDSSRPRIISALLLLAGKRESGLSKKHRSN
ncbi:MAG: methylmalonyl-CoA carboxyltransferase [Ruminococcaceae bacterium]|nr:methylmalonyl-CoA carboxyltransferase [Oscillospiraceae bacterium]